MDINQASAQLLEDGQRYRRIVHESPRLAGGIQLTPQNAALRIVLQVFAKEKGLQAILRDIKHGLDHTLLRPLLDALAIGPLPQHKGERTEDNGFSGSCLARNDRESRIEADVETVDQDKVLYE